MQLKREDIWKVFKKDQHKKKTKLCVAWLISILAFLIFLCFRYNAQYYSDKFVPLHNYRNLLWAIRLFIEKVTGHRNALQITDKINELGSIEFWGALAQLRIGVQAFIAGGALALAGAIFQGIYRNPMASPNMLGATAGVNLGNILMITIYSSSALSLPLLRYRYCYLLTIICVLAVLILGRLAGGKAKKTSVLEMVMAGSILSQVLNVFTQYYMYQLEDNDLLIYQELNLGTYLQVDRDSMTAFFIVMAVSIIPMLLLRFHFNVICLDSDEAITAGVNPRPVRIMGQVCGVLMVTAAMIHCGQVGMVTLVVPYIIRSFVGADVRSVNIYSFLMGGVLLIICRLAASFVLIEGVPIPVTFIMNLILTVLFIWILTRMEHTNQSIKRTGESK